MAGNNFAFGKENYIWMAAGFILVILGFILMSGGGSEDPSIFNPEIFSFRRITLAPVIIISGYILVIIAIMKKPAS